LYQFSISFGGNGSLAKGEEGMDWAETGFLSYKSGGGGMEKIPLLIGSPFSQAKTRFHLAKGGWIKTMSPGFCT